MINSVFYVCVCLCKNLKWIKQKIEWMFQNSKTILTWEHKIIIITIIIMCSHCVKLIGKEGKFRIKIFSFLLEWGKHHHQFRSYWNRAYIDFITKNKKRKLKCKINNFHFQLLINCIFFLHHLLLLFFCLICSYNILC